MKKLVLNIPDTVHVDETEAMSMLAASLYEHGKLSLGQAAEMAGYSKRTFMEILGNFDVSVFNDNEMDIESDIANAKSYHI